MAAGTDRCPMVERAGADEALYDVRLGQRPPDWLRSRFPSIAVHTTPTQTALRHRVSGLGQLDDFLQRLRAVGLVLTDVHRLSPPAPYDSEDTCGTYEVRVEGELGDPLLRYLRWPHHVVHGQTVVRIAAAPDALSAFLRSCTDIGLSIEQVRRVERR